MIGKKTKLMLATEASLKEPLEIALPHLVTSQGLSATADMLGVSKATLGYWLLKLNIEVRRVALAPGETVEVKRPPLPPRPLRSDILQPEGWP